MKNLTFPLMLICLFSTTLLFAQSEEKKEVSSSFLYKHMHSMQYDAVIHIQRNTKEQAYQSSLKVLKEYDQSVKIESTRNANDEISYLKFQNDAFSCSSVNFGSLLITIDDNKITSCGIVDIDHM